MCTNDPSKMSIPSPKKQEFYHFGMLAKEGIRARVVSMPCWEAFEGQTKKYRESVLPKSMKARVSIEAGVTFGWNRWIGNKGIAIGIDTFGASAPGPTNMEKFGLTADKIVKAVKKLVG